MSWLTSVSYVMLYIIFPKHYNVEDGDQINLLQIMKKIKFQFKCQILQQQGREAIIMKQSLNVVSLSRDSECEEEEIDQRVMTLSPLQIQLHAFQCMCQSHNYTQINKNTVNYQAVTLRFYSPTSFKVIIKITAEVTNFSSSAKLTPVV
ncbi:Hypothetical_protein [Hexamita inflata]|uniref:Hypothetical_protein n=1 Tax=Hexamita inflata TaxID=28002 RepID=A0AA86QM99_9EUKA|nr:Hypothetical protein HINF_LOCUS41965 [Hexamita inflata]